MTAGVRSAVKMSSNLLGRFRGCMVGAVVGDCLGSPFEGSDKVGHDDLNRYFTNFIEHKKKRGHSIKYTDDTAMARSVAASIISTSTIDTTDMANRFVEEYYREPDRGYGVTVVNVFAQLKEENCNDPYEPATKSFDGQGSGGNGAAMRIAPLALYSCYMDQDTIINMAKDVSKITHSHLDGINSAVLQCLAVHQALKLNDESIDINSFIDSLSKVMDDLDGPAPRRPKSKLDEEPKPFCAKLKKVVEYLKEPCLSTETVVDNLGNNVLGLGSVPTAIYCFLRAHNDQIETVTNGHFEKTVELAISLGGDTDTIATMAGAMAGAYWGVDAIPESWQAVCEPSGIEGALEQANQLFKLTETCQ